MGVYLPGGFATQGPSPRGFHVPLNTEWQAVYDIWTALGGGSSDGPNFGIALKLPFAGYRKSASASVDAQGTYGLYWSSSRRNASYAYRLYFRSTALNPQDSNYRTLGYSVRCFKNSPTVPTSSWTKLYGTSIEAGGIFWSGTDGLISLSSDGQTWVTIADKNLGATTVWNSGDTLSEANCGKYYQRGNNYGFPRTGTIANQSTTQVDASNYGPGNYYSSSTFITGNDWSSVRNDNLRGGEDGNVLTMQELKNAYIGEGIWKPDSSRTLLYLKFNNNLTDSSGNGVAVTTNGGTAPTYGTINSENYAIVSESRLISTLNSFDINNMTYSCWIKKTSSALAVVSYWGGVNSWASSTGKGNGLIIDSSNRVVLFPYAGDIVTSATIQLNTWTNIIIVANSGTSYIYINGELKATASKTFSSSSYIARFFANPYTNNRINDPLVGNIDELILENKAWTAQEISDYYNLTKSNYGL